MSATSRSLDLLCGDYPAPCNCDDPTTHDGAINDNFVEEHNFSTLYSVGNMLQNGVPRGAVGIPEEVTLTTEQILAAAKRKQDEHYAELKALTIGELVDALRESARSEGYDEAKDFGPSFPKYDSYNYAEEIKSRFEALKS